jgi:starch synthase
MARPLNFAIAYAVDSFSMAGKIMGRQSAGQGLLKAIVDTWPTGDLHALGVFAAEGKAFRGRMHWHRGAPAPLGDRLGALYWPAPVVPRLAHARNAQDPRRYSLFGVTHTLATAESMDAVALQALAPFQPWDALICTSRVARDVVLRLQADYRDWAGRELGADRFVQVQTPVIPLGVDIDALRRTPATIARARTVLGLAEDEVVFLFAGRLVFHAKANPAPFYRALEAAAARTGRRLVLLEAGVFPTPAVRDVYRAAQAALAPSVRIRHVDGADAQAYASAWQAADVFASLADNVQETFGLTPIEAMAAGLPVLVSDWNGYRDTVRDGLDGFRVRTVAAPPGAGADLISRYAEERDNYDQFVGRLSFATAVDVAELTDRIAALAEDAELRARMGASGRARAVADYRWPVILDRYLDLVQELDSLRRAAPAAPPVAWPARPDPFALFETYPTATLSDAWTVAALPGSGPALLTLIEVHLAKALVDDHLPRETLLALHRLAETGAPSVGGLVAAVGGPPAVARRGVMWLAKFGLVVLTPA